MSTLELIGLAIFIASLVAIHATAPRPSWRTSQPVTPRRNRRV